MARAATTLDPFNAIAEPKRRAVLGLLAKGEMPVNGLVQGLGWPQPQVSKHLKVLLEVGLVQVRQTGRQRVYRVNGCQMKTLHDWIVTFERLWDHQLLRIKERAEAMEKQP
ncbi:MAG: ArsR/SmtB family transcription factor [Tepidisphaeraceae bacterium]